MGKNTCDINTPINQVGLYLKKYFGQKTIKLALDGGFTCPNRDGTKGVGGCIFCSSDGSGDFAGSINDQIELLSKKWPDSKHIAYFQNHTNTYAPVEELRSKFYEVLKDPRISGLAIATRPDCITEEAYELLDELNKKTFLWVELGLQTIHESTGKLINRCCTLEEYDIAVKKLHKLGIRTVVHLIFGLPEETREQMLDSVRYVCRPLNSSVNQYVSSAHCSNKKSEHYRETHEYIFGIKIHMLNVVRGSQMEVLYPNYVSFEEIDDYIELVADALEIIPSNITIHRMSADAPRPILISPKWSFQKRTILNGIFAELHRRKSWQGKFAPYDMESNV